MPFDPALPADHSPLSSAEMRAQLTGLSDNITTATADKVTQSQLSNDLTAAINNTAMNPTNIPPMNISFSDPPSQADLLQVQSWLNGLLASLYRMP